MGVIRIIAGEWGSRKLNFPNISSIRPTPDRLRETIFNWLQVDIKNAICLDLFAGSGALGLEALSRGADKLVFVDQNRKAINHLRNNLKLLNCENAEVICADALKFISKSQQSFDFIFLDPPFNTSLLGAVVKLLQQQNILTKSGKIIIETEKLHLDLPLEVLRSTKSGQSNVFLVAL